MESPVLTIEETANYLKISQRQVYRLICKNQIESSKIGDCRRIIRKSVDEFIEKQIQNPRGHEILK